MDIDTASPIVIARFVNSVTILIKASLLRAGEAVLIGSHHIVSGAVGVALCALFIGVLRVVSWRQGNPHEIGYTIASNLAEIDLEWDEAAEQIRCEVICGVLRICKEHSSVSFELKIFPVRFDIAPRGCLDIDRLSFAIENHSEFLGFVFFLGKAERKK